MKLPDMAITKGPKRSLKKSSMFNEGLKQNEDFMDNF